ncbi:MAG TPA: GNAT family N-acetyltransferase [Chthonomonadaceae bacterium]|nr:GNAT family N-acetyltransferase [Chthonomonadaceae bacterium]
MSALQTSRDFRVRRMVRHDLNHSFTWSVQEGWNIGLHDHAVFFATDPQGFFLGERDGEPVGSISGVAYGDTFGFIGIYIVKPELRGHGYGIQLFRAAMDYLGARNVGLDGVIAQQENYKRSGFRLAYRNIRFGVAGGGEMPSGLTPLSAVPFEKLEAYDRRHFFAPRPTFLQGWIRQRGATALGVIQDGNLVGYGLVRPAVHGYLIGPLFAEDPATADLLFRALRAQPAGQSVFLDVPEVNPEALALAQRYGMQPVFETARMYTGPAPDLPLSEIYGVTTFELG